MTARVTDPAVYGALLCIVLWPTWEILDTTLHPRTLPFVLCVSIINMLVVGTSFRCTNPLLGTLLSGNCDDPQERDHPASGCQRGWCRPVMDTGDHHRGAPSRIAVPCPLLLPHRTSRADPEPYVGPEDGLPAGALCVTPVCLPLHTSEALVPPPPSLHGARGPRSAALSLACCCSLRAPAHWAAARAHPRPNVPVILLVHTRTTRSCVQTLVLPLPPPPPTDPSHSASQ